MKILVGHLMIQHGIVSCWREINLDIADSREMLHLCFCMSIEAIVYDLHSRPCWESSKGLWANAHVENSINWGHKRNPQVMAIWLFVFHCQVYNKVIHFLFYGTLNHVFVFCKWDLMILAIAFYFSWKYQIFKSR